MVMHARKLPRLDDGYFDKHQSHPYQASSKYNNSKGGYDRYNDRTRDSPNGTGLRSDSPNSFGDSPRDRSYVHKSSYSQRMRDKERDRDNRSPRDRDRQRDSDRRSNHDRGPAEEKPSRVGDWSEHVSSSGKKYYYNCKSEVSQWEKPRDWIDWEKEREHERERERYRRDRDRDRERDRDRKYDRQSYSSRTNAGSSSDRHSNFNRSNNVSNNSGGSNSNVSSRTAECRDNHRNHQSQQSLPEPPQSRRHSYERPSQDMDISPADSTPTSEASGPKAATPFTPDPLLTPTTGSTAPVSLATALPRLLSHPPTSTPTQLVRSVSQTPNASTSRAPNLLSPLQAGSSSMSSSSSSSAANASTLATLQQLLTQLSRTSVSGSLANMNPTTQSLLTSTIGRLGNINALGSLQNLEQLEVPAHELMQILQTYLASSQMPAATSGVSVLPKMSSLGSSTSDSFQGTSAPTPPEGDTANGPPTPTHSERLEADFRRGSPATSLSSLSAAAGSLRPQAASSHALTPSLAAYYRPDLISHVTGWQADHLEKQAMKLSEELHSIGNLHVTRVSAELKMARSLVRVADIQATLQEQRILFLRQQMKELEELKPPNHFMSD